MLTIALVSDNEALKRVWRGYLAEWGFRPWILNRDRAPLEQFEDRGADLILIDFSASNLDPVLTLRILKRDDELRHVPVVALCDPNTISNLDFSCGIEDFIVKDAPAEVLRARLKLALWRHSKVDSEDTIKAGNLVMNLASYQVSIEGDSVELTFKEYELLRFLMTHPGRVFSRDALLRHVWGEDYFGGTRTVDVHIRRLRSKIGSEFEDLIQTVRNVGYRFRAD